MFRTSEPVVCVENKACTFLIKKDEVYILNRQTNCRCGKLFLQVGVKNNTGNSVGARCKTCGCRYFYYPNEEIHFPSEYFRPLDSLYNEEIEELTELLTETIAI